MTHCRVTCNAIHVAPSFLVRLFISTNACHFRSWMFTQGLHNVYTMFTQCLHNVCTMLTQCLHNFYIMFTQCLHNRVGCQSCRRRLSRRSCWKRRWWCRRVRRTTAFWSTAVWPVCVDDGRRSSDRNTFDGTSSGNSSPCVSETRGMTVDIDDGRRSNNQPSRIYSCSQLSFDYVIKRKRNSLTAQWRSQRGSGIHESAFRNLFKKYDKWLIKFFKTHEVL